ncbi:MAG TPA: RecQ family ATP-dependent DNA helicase [Nocardioides sp.]|nr:RecQ family ATP-dependent DNA helicase [Nocardioides sp.]
MSDTTRIHETARATYGVDQLLPGQLDAVAALLDGHDVLLVAPTGWGKSLVYQVAGRLLGGLTVVVSPLLALQEDQVQSIRDSPGRRGAARISSAETAAELERTWAAAEGGEVDFLFLAPEQLVNEETRERLARLEPALVAVDEAHCVSAWGHDFRPDYRRLGEVIGDLGEPRIVATTATAAPPVRDDIVERLSLRDHRSVVFGFARDNIALDVRRCAGVEDQQQEVVDTVLDAAQAGQGILYCRTRPATQEYADLLAESGLRSATYHAGLPAKKRSQVHAAFMDGDVDVVVATSAFGMGIDKPDVRYVVHAQVPESPDTYYQEMGRAGRDDQPARAVLVYRPEDLSLGRYFSPGVPREDTVAAVLAAVDAVGPDPAAVQEHSGLGRRSVTRILNLSRQAQEVDGDLPEDRVAAVTALAEQHRTVERSRVEMMRAYAETDRCRAGFLLGYFGAEVSQRCGTCDNCRSGRAAEPAADDGDFPVQARVVHPEFGDGTVTDVEEDRLTVLFEQVGYRTLSRRLVHEEDLLQRA